MTAYSTELYQLVLISGDSDEDAFRQKKALGVQWLTNSGKLKAVRATDHTYSRTVLAHRVDHNLHHRGLL